MPNPDLIDAARIHHSQFLTNIDWASLVYQFASLPFNMQAQTQTNWCWAATATSVSHFYMPLSTWTQCRVAGAELQRTDCCNAPVPSPCNVPWYLDRALTRTSNFDRFVSGTISYNDILAEIQAGRVVGARQGWSGGGGHFMVIYGCSRIGSTRYLDIDDPIFGKNTMTYDTFATNYQGSGTWTHTYFTKRRRLVIFDFPRISERIFDLIDQTARLRHLRSGLDISAYNAEKSVSVPHPVFVAGLDMIAKGKIEEKPSGLRVLQLKSNAIEALYDFDIADAENPQMHGFNDNPAFNAVLSQALDAVGKLPLRKEKAGGKSAAPELRYLKLPALYVEGFWVSEPGGKSDTITLTRGGMFLPEMQTMPMADFMRAVQAEAKTRLANSKDDTIAP